MIEQKVDRRRGRPRDASGHFLPASDEQTISPPSERQSFLARNRNRRASTTEDVNQVIRSPGARSHALAGQVTVEHEFDPLVKMWKPGPYGWQPRGVPSKAIGNNLANGWMEHCPDCGGTECTDDPNSCPAKRGRRFIVCPVPNCNADGNGPKRIYATGFGHVVEAEPQEHSEYQVGSPYANFNTETELKGKMDLHLMTFHRDEARMLGLFSGQAAAPRIGMEVGRAEEA